MKTWPGPPRNRKQRTGSVTSEEEDSSPCLTLQQAHTTGSFLNKIYKDTFFFFLLFANEKMEFATVYFNNNYFQGYSSEGNNYFAANEFAQQGTFDFVLYIRALFSTK